MSYGRDEERPSPVNADLLARWKVHDARALDATETAARYVLYAAAEDASDAALSLEEAIQAVMDGYSSLEADRLFRADP